MLRFNWSKAAKYPASPGKEVPIYIYMFDLYTVINWKGIGTACVQDHTSTYICFEITLEVPKCFPISQ